MIIDSHCHLHDEKFTHDLAEVLQRAKDANISHMISIGCDIKTTKAAYELAQQQKNIYFSAGFHPHEAKFLTEENFIQLSRLAENKKCVAIGECGLDYYYNHSNQEEQKKAFIAQIELAKKISLPLIIHLRDAFDDCIDILERYRSKNQQVLIHCFSGSIKEALEFVKHDCFISLSGIITFKKPGDLLLVAKQIPLTKLMIETDSPYLAPHPYRGQRNEPSYILNTLLAIAQARGEVLNKVEEQIYQNTQQFFKLA